jgi:hypothetical protein
MTFKASFDWKVKLITSSFAILVLTFLWLSARNFDTLTSGTVFSLIGLVLILGTYLWHPQSYKITEGGIIINRPIGSKLLGFSSIKHIKRVENDDLGFVLRLFGNGGLFGFTGLFKSRFQGDLTFYATQQRNYVIVETDLKKCVLTPDEPFDFVKNVESRVGVI